MYQIEKNVPLPQHERRGRAIYPFEQMSVGDSFAISAEHIEGLRGTLPYWRRKLGHKYTIRKQQDGTIRCWRVE